MFGAAEVECVSTALMAQLDNCRAGQAKIKLETFGLPFSRMRMLSRGL